MRLGETGASPPFSGGGSNPGNLGSSPLQDLAFQQETFQSSTAFGGVSSRAVDGHPNGNFSSGSVTQTARQTNPEWHVVICPGQIENIMIFNRTDCCSDRLQGANLWFRRYATHEWEHVTTLETSASSYSVQVGATRGTWEEVAIVLDGQARILSLAEVYVSGVPIGQCP
jgi:hypothetical protein